MEQLTNERLKDLLRVNIYELLVTFIEEQVPFKIILWNRDDWDMPLPEQTMKNYPLQLVLEISGETLSSAEIVDDMVQIRASFEGNMEWTKIIGYHDTVGIISLEGNPYQINNFYPEDDDIEQPLRFTKQELLLSLQMDGVLEEDAKRSIEAFAKFNPDRFPE